MPRGRFGLAAALSLAALTAGACSEDDDQGPGNHLPEVPALDLSINEDSQVTLNLLTDVHDADGDALRVLNAAIGDQPMPVDASGLLTFAPPPNFFGRLPVTFQVSDGTDVVAGAWTLTVRPVQDAPTARGATLELAEDSFLSLAIEAADLDREALTYTIEAPAHGTLAGTAPLLIYTPHPNYHGADEVRFSVSDGLATASATVVLNVLPVNDAPTATSKTLSLAEDTALPFTFEGSDVEGSPLTFAIAVPPLHGTVTGEGAERVYTPSANRFGPDELTYVVSDGAATSTLAKITFNVASVDDPTTALPVSLAATEDVAAPVLLLGGDADGTPLTYATSAPSHGTLTGTAPALTYTPAPNYHGSDSFTYTVTSAGSPPATATVSLTVAAVNDAPVAVSGAAAMAEDTSMSIHLEGSDVDSPALSYTVTAPLGDTVVRSGVSDFLYTPASNANGARTLRFVVSDGQLSANGTFIVTVAPVNDPPVARRDLVITPKNQPIDITVLFNDSDLDGDELTVVSVVQPAHGRAMTEDGLVTYSPDDEFTGTDQVTYVISDPSGATATAVVDVGVDMFPAGLPRQTIVAATQSNSADDPLRRPSISHDGRFVAFGTKRALTFNDGNDFEDIYVYDRLDGSLRLISLTASNGSANSDSHNPNISGNGRYVVFWSYATNLLPGGNGHIQCYRHDLQTGQTIAVSVSGTGEWANNSATLPVISDDGNRIAFASYAGNLVPGENNYVADIFVRDVAAGTTVRASDSAIGAIVDASARTPVISGDGKVVAFVSAASNLVAGGSNGFEHIYVSDLEAHTLERASVSSAGAVANRESLHPSLSRDGKLVTFTTWASNLVPDVAYGSLVRDRTAQTTARATASGGSSTQLSGDGRYLTTHNFLESYVSDRLSGTTLMLTPPNGARWSWPVISGNGEYIVLYQNFPNGSLIVLPNPF